MSDDAVVVGPNDLVEQGRVLHREGRLEEAERLYAQALAADEYCADAHQLLAVIAGQRGKFEQAIAGFRRTIALEGPTADRLFNLAEACRVSGNFQAALDAYNQALTIDASYLDAYRNCAAMVKDAAERAQAGGDTASARQLRSLAGHYMLGLGHACFRATDATAAEAAYREATTLNPDNAEAYNCLGTIALEGARPIEAEGFYRRAHEIEPISPLFLNNLGRSLLSQVRVAEAADAFRGAIEIDPTFAEARTHLEERVLRWLHYCPDLAPGAIYAAHSDWGTKEIARAAADTPAPLPHTNLRDPTRCLRVAYLGLDEGSRLTKSCFEPLLASHDPRVVTPIIFVTRAAEIHELQRLRSRYPNVLGVGLQRAQEVARLMRERGVDILVDLAGHMPHNRLDILARRPAPVTVTWLGYPGTTGLPNVDWRVTDEVSDPPGAEEFHSERLYRLKQGSFVYRPPEAAQDITALPARQPGAVTFGNFDDPRKISSEMIQLWSAILDELPSSRLLLMAREFSDAAFAAGLRSRFQAAGIGPGRLELRVRLGEHEGSLSAYGDIDIALDTVPHNGDLTNVCESLWMGVPVVTLSGDRSCGRTSASILSQVGLERLDSHTSQEYAETAVELAQDLDRLLTLRSGMRERMRVSPLMDERGFARRFEAALRDLWLEWCKSGA